MALMPRCWDGVPPLGMQEVAGEAAAAALVQLLPATGSWARQLNVGGWRLQLHAEHRVYVGMAGRRDLAVCSARLQRSIHAPVCNKSQTVLFKMNCRQMESPWAVVASLGS